MRERFISQTCPTKIRGSISPIGISLVVGFAASRRESLVWMAVDRSVHSKIKDEPIKDSHPRQRHEGPHQEVARPLL